MTDVDKLNRGRHSAAQAAGSRRKRRRRGKRTLYYILIIIFLLAAGVALSLTVFFKIESITAVGTDKYLPDEIVAASGIQQGDNLFRVPFQDVKQRILAQYPYIGSVEVRLRPPGEVRINLTQCVPAWAMIEENGETVMITREGKVLERGIVFIPDNVPVVKGVATAGAKPGEQLGEEVAESLTILDYLLEAVAETDFGIVTNVDLTDRYNIKIVYENRLLLKLGTESELPAKLNFIKEAVGNKLEPDAEGFIDASNINRSLNYMRMPIADALAGKKRASDKTEAEPKPEPDALEEDEPADESDAEPIEEIDTAG